MTQPLTARSAVLDRNGVCNMPLLGVSPADLHLLDVSASRIGAFWQIIAGTHSHLPIADSLDQLQACYLAAVATGYVQRDEACFLQCSPELILSMIITGQWTREAFMLVREDTDTLQWDFPLLGTPVTLQVYRDTARRTRTPEILRWELARAA
jgi:hypothetical protein